ncbi:uncharacterized protein LOC107261680 isoform X2 [Ricinus communis]|uniref:uncharacterized protein LOC107261680 isoform X2 n=1 Tax=Ricinus communis TaxID=3988 RepID=UPI00201AC507|nr:uncharacterized protein LOC107261680 isoform X2 [Ricinus communis]
MVHLLLSKPNWKEEDGDRDSDLGKQWVLLLNKLESIIWSLINAGGGRSEARLWLCSSIAAISSLTSRQQKDLFVGLLRRKPTNRSLASQLLQMMFEKRRRKVGAIVAKRSYLLEKFFDDHKKGAKALSQFAFVNRDICWEELQWKGKHGQSPAVVATKPHYFLDLDVQKTVENFLENVPEFWSSSEFAESLRDGDILFVDTKYFVEFFVGLMYEEDAKDVWKVINEFLMEEYFSSLCKHLLITLEEEELCTVLELLRKYLGLRMESIDFGNSSCWLELVLSKSKDCKSLDQLLLLNAFINQGRQLLRLLHDEEAAKEQTKIKDIVSQICTVSSNANYLVPLLSECFKLKFAETVKFLGLQSWVIHYALLEESRTSESWESLFSNNGISFRKSDKYALVVCDGFSEENDSELDNDASIRRKGRRKKKSRKKRRRNSDDDDFNENELLDFDTSNNWPGLQSRATSWLLSTDGFSASWTNVDLPEHLSKFCFSTWMKWLLTEVA